MLEADKDGTKPLFRDRNWNKDERISIKQNQKHNWYRKNPKINYKTVLFVPPTPRGILAKELTKREDELNKHSNSRIKIVEKGGVKIENILTTKNPFPKSKCKEKWCPLCQNSENKNKVFCYTNNVGYRWICKTCQERNIDQSYEGETSRSARVRGKEHLDGFKSRNGSKMNFLILIFQEL